MGETFLTKAGLEKLKDERKALQKQRVALLEEVSQAAAMGDLRENAEYHAARERLQHVSTRLAEFDGKLAHVRIIDDLEIAEGEARVGASVTLQDLQTKEAVTYLLVGPDEADPLNGKLSIVSPLGKSLLGKKAGEHVTLTLPKMIVPYKVLKIARV
jgi:transcription elongation factor GreA